jgi:hypothetical protein
VQGAGRRHLVVGHARLRRVLGSLQHIALRRAWPLPVRQVTPRTPRSCTQ